MAGYCSYQRNLEHIREEEQKEAVGLVMDFGKPDVNAVNNEGKTVLDIATEKNDEALIKFLLKYY